MNTTKTINIQEKFDLLSPKQKKLLIQLSVFGDEKTSISTFFEFYGFNDDNEKNDFFELIYELSSSELIVLTKEKFILNKEFETFLFDRYPPNINNSRIFIEYFLDLLHPPVEKNISPQKEILLQKVISRIQGYSAELAMLSDFYAQYLMQQEDLRSSVNFFILAIDIQSKFNEHDVLMCNYYNHLAEAYLSDKMYEKAIDTALKSVHLTFNLPRKDHIVLVYSYSLISTAYFRQKNHKLSYEYNIKAIDVAVDKEFDDLLLANLYYEASVSATKVKENNEAFKFISKAFISVMALPLKERNEKLIEKIRLHHQYLGLMKKVNNSILKYAKKSHIYILLAIIVLLVTIMIIV